MDTRHIIDTIKCIALLLFWSPSQSSSWNCPLMIPSVLNLVLPNFTHFGPPDILFFMYY